MQFLPRIRRGEAPRNSGFGRVACVFIGGDCTPKRGVVWDTLIQALPTQNAQLDFCHVQPTAVLGRIMKLQLLQQAPGLRWGKSLVQRGRFVRVEVVHNNPNHGGFRVPLIDQPLHLVGKILHCPAFRDGNMSPAGLRLNKHKEIAGAVPLVLIVVPRGSSWCGEQGRAGLPNQLFAGFIKVDLGPLGIIGLGIKVQHILHGGHELGAHFRQTPLLLLPRFEFVFLSTWRTVSWAMVSAKPSSTTLAASSRNVHRAWPAGAGVQATAITCASCLPVNLRCAPGRACSSSAPRFSSTNRCRVRPTVAVPTYSAAAISSSLRPSSALSRIRARVSLRVPACPRRRSCANVVRSSVLKATRYFFLGMSGLSGLRVCPDG